MGGDLVSFIIGSHSSSLQRQLAARREDFTTLSDGKRSAIPDDPPDINSLFDWRKLYLEFPIDILSAGGSTKKNDLVRRSEVSKHYKEYRKAYQSSKTPLTMISLHIFRSGMIFTLQ